MLMFARITFLRSHFVRQMLVGGFCFLPAILFAQAPAPVDGLADDLLPGLKPILRAALERSPQMISSSIGIAQAEAGRIGSNSSLWPTLGGGGSYGVTSASTDSAGLSSSSDSTGLSYSAALGQPIFQWGALKYRSDIGRIGVKIAEKQYAEAYRLLAVTLRTQYLALIYKHATLRYYRSALKMADNALETEKARLAEGTISQGDLIGPTMAAADAALATERAAAEYAYFRRIFTRLAGISELSEDAVPFDVPRPVPSPELADQLVHAFLKEGAGVTNQGQIYLMTIKQQDLNYRIARTGLLPKFSLSANYGLSFSTSVTPTTVNIPDPKTGTLVPTQVSVVSQSAVTSRGYGISGSWTLFDGFATRAAKLSALATKRLTERQLQSYADTVVDTAQSMLEQWQFAARALDLAQKRHDLAQAAVTRTNEDFKLGLAPQSAVDSANAGLLSADATIVYTRADYLNRWADLVSLVGADPVMNNLPARYVRSTK